MPRTEHAKQKRAQKRRQQRRAKLVEGTAALVTPVAVCNGGAQPSEHLAVPSAEQAPAQPPAERQESKYSIDDVVGAVGQIINILNDFKEVVSSAVGQLEQGQQELSARIATIEQAQQQGLETLATQSGLGMLGLTGQVPGEQAALVQSSSYRAMRETEQQILSDEGYDLAVPQDGHTIIVGAVTEEQVKSRREALQKMINEQHGGLIR